MAVQDITTITAATATGKTLTIFRALLSTWLVYHLIPLPD